MMAFGDYKTLISIIRSNGGASYICDGIVVKQWPGFKVRPEKLKKALKEDPETLTAKGSIGQHVFVGISFLLVFALIIIFRYVCSIVFEKMRKKDWNERFVKTEKVEEEE